MGNLRVGEVDKNYLVCLSPVWGKVSLVYKMEVHVRLRISYMLNTREKKKMELKAMAGSHNLGRFNKV